LGEKILATHENESLQWSRMQVANVFLFGGPMLGAATARMAIPVCIFPVALPQGSSVPFGVT
jgi:hypothetical protein